MHCHAYKVHVPLTRGYKKSKKGSTQSKIDRLIASTCVVHAKILLKNGCNFNKVRPGMVSKIFVHALRTVTKYLVPRTKWSLRTVNFRHIRSPLVMDGPPIMACARKPAIFI